MRIQLAAIALVFLAVSPVHAAAPAVPGSFSYQGVLLDSAGQPQSGPVDLVIRLWDAGFAGTLLYKQEFNNTVLVDGVFSVKLGPSGVGTDVPISPLTLDLVDAVTTDLGASGAVWIEVSVDGNTPLTRTQFRAVPFALKAESAADLLTPGGVSATALDAIWQNFNFDGGGPANTAASEGTGDTDQDGILNFIDPDNDNDGFSDITETVQGSNINLVTPRITSLSDVGSTYLNVPINATGQSFDPAMSVTVGGAGVTPTGVTPSSFDFVAPPMPLGTVAVVATHPNGEMGSTTLSFVDVTPQIDSFSGDGSSIASVQLSATGSGFDPAMTVTLDGVGIVATAITPTSFDFLAPPMAPGLRLLVITHPSGGIGSRDLLYTAAAFGGGPTEAVAIGVDQLLIHADATYSRDTADDGQVLLGSLLTVPNSTTETTSIHWDSTGRLAALRRNSSTDSIEVLIDTDLDGNLEATEAQVFFSVPGGAMTGSSLVHDAADHVAFAYLRSSLSVARVQIGHDLDGSGDFSGSETLVAEFVPGGTLLGVIAPGELAADSANRLAYVYEAPVSGQIRVLWDRNGNSVFTDTVGGNAEIFSAATSAPTCLGSDFDAADGLAVVYGDGSGLHLLHDTSGDGDFGDAGEAVTLVPADQVSSPTGCDIDASGTGLAIAVTDGSNLSLLVDRNGDADFADTNEDVLLTTGAAAPLAVERVGTGQVVVAGPNFFLQDPN